MVNNTGMIRARSIGMRDGSVVLDGGAEGVVMHSGSIDVSGLEAGEKGGSAKLLGDKVALTGMASIDARGDAGGGSVLVGGDYQGKGAEQNASATYVGQDAAIAADAVNTGDGGKVIVWADDVTRYYGSISARGGAQAGNGGFAKRQARKCWKRLVRSTPAPPTARQGHGCSIRATSRLRPPPPMADSTAVRRTCLRRPATRRPSTLPPSTPA